MEDNPVVVPVAGVRAEVLDRLRMAKKHTWMRNTRQVVEKHGRDGVWDRLEAQLRTPVECSLRTLVCVACMDFDLIANRFLRPHGCSHRLEMHFSSLDKTYTKEANIYCLPQHAAQEWWVEFTQDETLVQHRCGVKVLARNTPSGTRPGTAWRGCRPCSSG